VKTDVALHTGQQTYISLYTGGGGLDLGFRLANPDAVPLLYVERELPAAALVVDHIEAGLLDAAPVWADTGTLDCKPFADKVDWIIGGFPCQPFSVAGKQRGTEDQRWLWEHIRRLAVEIRPRYLFLENTPGLLVHSGIGTILGDLSEIGFNDVEWTSVRASDVGAPHRRERVFILAYSTSSGSEGSGLPVRPGRPQQAEAVVDGRSRELANSTSERPREAGRHIERPTTRTASDRTALGNASSRRSQVGNTQPSRAVTEQRSSYVGNADSQRRRTQGNGELTPAGIGWGGRPFPWPPGPGSTEDWREVIEVRPDLAPATQPEVRGVANGLAPGLARTDRLRILGNGVVPQQAALAFQILKERITNGSTSTSK